MEKQQQMYWQTLLEESFCIDRRALQTPKEIAEACFNHMKEAYNGGRIKPTITIFASQKPSQHGITIFNHQLVRYAGFEQPDGSVTGDPDSIALTNFAQSLGWKPPIESAFKVLPLILKIPGQNPYLMPLPDKVVHEVYLSHPQYSWFQDLELQWYAIPALSDMRLEIGGLHYTAAPFNGWYMGTEIGSRNFGDPHRYDMLPKIAKKMRLDPSSNPLWKDRALIELNRGVLHSYTKAGIKIVDHHTASEQFMHHKRIENGKERSLTGDWSWLVPPLSGSSSPIFFEEIEDKVRRPNFFYQ